MAEETNVLPNSVLFKTDLGQVCIVFINPQTGQADWDNVNQLDISSMVDKFDDVSIKDPFEWVFCWFKDNTITTTKQKSAVPNYSFTKLHDEGLLQRTIEHDYYKQFLSSKNIFNDIL